MKYIQTWISKSLAAAVMLLAVCFAAQAQPNAYLQKADTLFKKKQYTQSFELYKDLFAQKKYSPAMLLKMAYIQEGLGHVSQSLYYLTLYYKVTRNEEVLAKIDEVAANNKLEGYGVTPASKFITLLEDNYATIAGVLAVIALFFIALGVLEKRKRRSPVVMIVLAGIVMALLMAHVNFSVAPRQGIIANPYTYIMTGPSAGASLVGIVGAGHQLEILGNKDVWMKVEWAGKEAYVREGEVLVEKL